MSSSNACDAMLVILALVLAGAASAQAVREVIPAPATDPIRLLEDGTEVRTAEAVPECIAIQNFLIVAAVQSRTKMSWSGFAEELGMEPSGPVAKRLKSLANQVSRMAEEIPLEPSTSTSGPSPHEVYFEAVGHRWEAFINSLRGHPEVRSAIDTYIDRVIRSSTQLITPPEFAGEMDSMLPAYQAAFEEGRRQP